MSGGRSCWRQTGRRLARLPPLVAHVFLGVLIAAALGPGQARRYRSTAPLAWWSRHLCRLLGVRVHSSGIPCRGSALFVANHISWLDIFCIAAVCPTHFLAKHEVAAWPLLGWLCRRAGTAFIRRGEAGGASEAAGQLARRLRQGGRVLVFPEGTSTDGVSVRRFYPRLFHAALLARCPVQAIALRYPRAGGLHPTVPFVDQDSLLPHLWRLLGEPAIDVQLSFGAVRNPPHPSRDLLAKQTRSEIETLLSIIATREERASGDVPQPIAVGASRNWKKRRCPTSRKRCRGLPAFLLSAKTAGLMPVSSLRDRRLLQPRRLHLQEFQQTDRRGECGPGGYPLLGLIRPNPTHRRQLFKPCLE